MRDLAKPRADEAITDDRGFLTRFWFKFFADVGDVVSGQRTATLREVTMDALPQTDKSRGGVLIVTDESGGATLAWCDGTNWRRATDNAIVS